MNLIKKQKILVVLYRFSHGKKSKMKFEDIVVALFKKYPAEFQLKGYPVYPDSDLIRRPLYRLRNEGLLQAANMIFTFTEKGLDMAGALNRKVGKKKVNSNQIFARYIESEIKRVLRTNAYKLFSNENDKDILDTDFFEYLGISVRADKVDFQNRLKVLNEMAQSIEQSNASQLVIIPRLHKFLKRKFRKEILHYKS